LSEPEISRSDGIFDDDEGFALMLLRRKLEAGSELDHHLIIYPAAILAAGPNPVYAIFSTFSA